MWRSSPLKVIRSTVAGKRFQPAGIVGPSDKVSDNKDRQQDNKDRQQGQDNNDRHCRVGANRRADQVDRRNLCVGRWFRSPRVADSLPLAPWWRGRAYTRKLGDVAEVMWCRIACPAARERCRPVRLKCTNDGVDSELSRPAAAIANLT